LLIGPGLRLFSQQGREGRILRKREIPKKNPESPMRNEGRILRKREMKKSYTYNKRTQEGRRE
jgi:hypothetical protein